MANRCPGQDTRKISAQSIICGRCAQESEIFSDESWIYCTQCRTRVYRHRKPSCVDWCASAGQCAGE